MNKKKLVGTITILIVAIIGCVLIAYGFNIFRSPKNITITTVDTLSKELFSGLNQEETVKSFYNFVENTDKIRMQANIDLTLDEKLGLETNQFGLDMDITENKEAQKSSIDVTYSQGLESLVLSIISTNDKTYLMIKDAFQKYYYEDQEYQSLFSNIEYINYDIFRELFIESLKNSLKDKDFTSEKTTITVNEEDVKVTKNSIPLDKTHITVILEEFFKQLQNNEEAMNTLVNLTGKTKEEIIASMNDTITSAKEDMTNMETETFPTLSVYIKGFNEVLLTELGDEDLKFQYYTYEKTRELSIIEKNSGNDYEYEFDDDSNYDYNYTVGELANDVDETTTTITVKFVAKDTKTTEVTATVNGVEIVSGTMIDNGNEKQLDFNVTIQSLTFHLTGTVTAEEISANSEYHTKLDLTATMTVDQEYTFHLLMDATFSIGEEVDTTMLEDALPMDQMTQEDALALYNMPIFGSLLQGYSTLDGNLSSNLFA